MGLVVGLSSKEDYSFHFNNYQKLRRLSRLYPREVQLRKKT